jgi:hypothetical protein
MGMNVSIQFHCGWLFYFIIKLLWMNLFFIILVN